VERDDDTSRILQPQSAFNLAGASYGAGTRAAIEARKISDLGKAIDFAMSPNLGNAYSADTKAADTKTVAMSTECQRTAAPRHAIKQTDLSLREGYCADRAFRVLAACLRSDITGPERGQGKPACGAACNAESGR